MPKRGGRKKHRSGGGGAPKEGARVAQPASLKKKHGKVHKFNNADQQLYDKYIEQSLETADRKRTKRGLGSKRHTMKEEALYTDKVGFRQGISYRNWPVEFVKSSEVYNPNKLVESLSGLRVASDEDSVHKTNMSIIELNDDLSEESEESQEIEIQDEVVEESQDEVSESEISDEEELSGSEEDELSHAVILEDDENEEVDDDDSDFGGDEEPSFIIDVDGDESLEELHDTPGWVGSIKPYFSKDEESSPYISSSSNAVAGTRSNRGYRTVDDYQVFLRDDHEGETTTGIADDELSIQHTSRKVFADVTIPGDDMLDSDIDISDLAKLQSRDLDMMDLTADFYMRIRESRVGADGPQHYVMLEGEENWVDEEELLESLEATLSISRANAYGIILQSGGTDYGQAVSEEEEQDEASYYHSEESEDDDDDDESEIDAVIASLLSEDGGSKRGRKRQESILNSFSEPSQPQYKGKGKNKVPNFGIDLDPEMQEYLGQQWLKSRAAKAERKKQRETLRQEGKLSKHYKNSGEVLLADTYTTAMTFDQINLAIVNFLHNESLTTLSFPPMGFKERDLLKEIAACYKLQAKSLMDKKRNKFIGMIKKDLTNSDPNEVRLDKLRQKKDWYPRSDVGMSRGKMIGLNRRDHARSSTDRRVKVLPKSSRGGGGSGGGNSHREGDVVGSEAREIESENIGRRLLERMGWQTGTGLGVSKSGITVPVAATVKLSKRGLGNTL